jgi:hypothetical protein
MVLRRRSGHASTGRGIRPARRTTAGASDADSVGQKTSSNRPAPAIGAGLRTVLRCSVTLGFQRRTFGSA